MPFACVGASRTGKTTLAKRLCDDMGFFYKESSFGRIAKDLGMDAVAPHDIMTRCDMQERVLDVYLKELDQAPRPFITDRTPLDMIGYMLGDVTMHNTSRVEGKRINAYVERCLSATVYSFDSVVILRPLPFYASEDGKPGASPAYQLHVQLLIEGSFDRIAEHVTGVVLDTADLDQRIEAAGEFFASRCDLLNESRNNSCLH